MTSHVQLWADGWNVPFAWCREVLKSLAGVCVNRVDGADGRGAQSSREHPLVAP
jgi:hypothetical protein